MKTTLLTALLIALLLTGCAKSVYTVTLPSGVTIKAERSRFCHDEQIGPISFDATDGSFTAAGYIGEQAQILDALKALLAVRP